MIGIGMADEMLLVQVAYAIKVFEGNAVAAASPDMCHHPTHQRKHCHEFAAVIRAELVAAARM